MRRDCDGPPHVHDSELYTAVRRTGAATYQRITVFCRFVFISVVVFTLLFYMQRCRFVNTKQVCVLYPHVSDCFSTRV